MTKIVFDISSLPNINILELIHWAHQNNKFQHSFGIGFHFKNGTLTRTFETNCPQLANSLVADFPNAKTIDNFPGVPK